MPVSNGQLHQDIGELKAEMRNVKQDVSEMRKHYTTVKQDIGEMHDLLMQAKGFKYAWVVMLGAASVLGGVFVKLAGWIGFLPK